MNNNSFLSGYNKKDNTKKDVLNVNVDKASLRYEEKSGFKPPKKKDYHSAKGSSKSKMMVWIIVGAAVLIAVLAGVMLILGGSKVELKDFEDWALGDVQLWANENSVKLQIEEVYNDTFEAGRVISQTIAQGEKINKGDFLGLTVSLGHDLSITLDLPDLMNMTKAQIESWAEENFMTKVRITTEYSDDVVSGNVIRFEINDNTVVDNVRRDTPIYIVVSKGAEDENAIEIEVPDFKTMPLSECYAFANDNGLLLSIEEVYDDYAPSGTIISQSVKAESKIKKGDEIILTVSLGKKIVMLDFSDYSKENALSAASELGIPVTVKERYSSSSEGAFLSQSIAAGTVLKKGDYLELCYSMGNKIVVSSFVGQTRDAIENWAKELNAFEAKITIKATYTTSNEPAGTIIHQDIANQIIGRRTTINITVSKGKLVFVPDFVAAQGVGYDVAITREKALQMCETLGIVPIFVEESTTNRLPGEIWQQSIAAGEEVCEGSTITLKFTPTENTVVPDFLGMTKEEVLAANYHLLLNIIFEDSEDVVLGYEGKIYAQSLLADTIVVKGSTITLTSSAVSSEEPTP